MSQPPPPPQPYPPAYPPPPPPRRSPWGRCCLIVVLLLGGTLVCLLLAGGAAYYAFTTGAITRADVMRLIGQGPAELNIANLSDDSLSVSLTRLDTEDGTPSHEGDLLMATLDLDGFVVQPGYYQLDFSSAVGAPEAGTCLLRTRGGDVYQFVVVPQGIAVTREGADAETREDLLLATSPLCAQ